MDEMITWLRAEIEADLAAAQESYYEGQRWLTEEEDVYRWPDDELVHSADRKADARHIARHDPRDAITDCEAKLAVLDEHGGEHMCFENTRDGNTWDYYIGDCRIVRLLASGYRHRDGYREEWKP